MDINAARAAEANGSMDKVAELLTWRDSKLFSEAERVEQVVQRPAAHR